MERGNCLCAVILDGSCLGGKLSERNRPRSGNSLKGNYLGINCPGGQLLQLFKDLLS